MKKVTKKLIVFFGILTGIIFWNIFKDAIPAPAEGEFYIFGNSVFYFFEILNNLLLLPLTIITMVLGIRVMARDRRFFSLGISALLFSVTLLFADLICAVLNGQVVLGIWSFISFTH